MRIRTLLLAAGLLFAALAGAGLGRALRAEPPPVIWINEFLADNDHVIADEYGEYDDVLELHNPGPADVSLGGMYLTDDLGEPTQFRITDTLTLPAGGYLLFWADGTPDQGATHTSFALSKGGESIGLFDTDANGNAPVDTYTFGPQAMDVSEARCPDGGPAWLFDTSPTMGATNEPCGLPPSISGSHHDPAYPQAGEAVTVTATITDDVSVVGATLWFSASAGFLPVPLVPRPADQYEAAIPGQPDGTWVRYYLEARDEGGWTSLDPPGAPAQAYSYVAGYQPPLLALNELMADNVSTLEDPDEPGEFPDWLELHNPSSQALPLGGLYLSDDLWQPDQFRIPDGLTVPAGGFLVFYADGEPHQGPLHTNFKLSAGGEALGLFGAGGRVLLDAVVFPALGPDAAYGRRPDGTGAWGNPGCATPGASNLTCCRAYLAVAAQAAGPPPLPLHVDWGSSVPYTAADGTVYIPEREWLPGRAWGAQGGYADLPLAWWEGNPVGTSNDPVLYRSLRRDWQELRLGGLPDGDYLLTLRFNEQIHHGPGFSVFDVTLEGQTVLDDLDVWAEVGRYYALNARFAVHLTDGELNIGAAASAGESHIAALDLAARTPDVQPPGVPGGLEARSSYAAILLDWADLWPDDLAGYHVYRAANPQGPYTRLTQDRPGWHSRYQDRDVVPHQSYYYRVSAVDAYGNESAQTAAVSAAAIELNEASLPVYRLEVTPENLALLYADPWSDIRVPASFTLQGTEYPAEARFRGSSGRSFPKKSWKVVFTEDSPFANQDRINVNAFWMDASLMRPSLSAVLFEAAGLGPPRTEVVLLALNGEYMGVYTRVEQVDEGFLLRTGRNPGASIYKVVDRFGQLLPDEATYRAYYEKETNEHLGYEDLISFIELLNNTPDDQFPAALQAVMDVEAFLEHYAVQVLLANNDSARHNLYLVHDLDTGLWELVPWDLEMDLSSVATPIDAGTWAHPERFGGSNALRSRVLAVPQFRALYCDRLHEYMATIFAGEALHPQVDALYAAVEEDGLRDWLKPGWEQPGGLTNAPAQIKAFITDRRAFLEGEMLTFCP